MHALSITDFKKLIQEDAIVLDTRPVAEFTRSFVTGAVSIAVSEKMEEWATSLLSVNDPILLITSFSQEQQIHDRLEKAGFNNIKGYLDGGYATWEKEGEETDMIIDVEADELMMDIPFDDNLVIIDVRKPVEFAEGHLKEAMNIPLADMKDPASMANIDHHHNLYVHCAAGYRSVIAASLLKRQGIHNLRNIVGGWNAIKEEEKAEIVKEASGLN